MYRGPPARAWWPAVGAFFEEVIGPRRPAAAATDAVLAPSVVAMDAVAISFARHRDGQIAQGVSALALTPLGAEQGFRLCASAKCRRLAGPRFHLRFLGC